MRPAARRLRLVTRERRAQRAADRRARHPAGGRAARRAAHGRVPPDGRRHRSDRARPRCSKRGPHALAVALFDREAILTRWK